MKHYAKVRQQLSPSYSAAYSYACKIVQRVSKRSVIEMHKILVITHMDSENAKFSPNKINLNGDLKGT